MIRDDLAQRYPKTLSAGRKSTLVEIVLRMLAIKHLYDLNYEQAVLQVADSLVLLKLFPKQVRDRMLAETRGNCKTAAFLHGESKDGRPNADLFPETTIMFGDLSGFTAWSR